MITITVKKKFEEFQFVGVFKKKKENFVMFYFFFYPNNPSYQKQN